MQKSPSQSGPEKNLTTATQGRLRLRPRRSGWQGPWCSWSAASGQQGSLGSLGRTGLPCLAGAPPPKCSQPPPTPPAAPRSPPAKEHSATISKPRRFFFSLEINLNQLLLCAGDTDRGEAVHLGKRQLVHNIFVHPRHNYSIFRQMCVIQLKAD